MKKRDHSLFIMAGVFILVISAIISVYKNESKEEFQINAETFCLNNVNFKIKSACIANSNLKVKIENNNLKIEGLNIIILNKTINSDSEIDKETKEIIIPIENLNFKDILVSAKINFNNRIIQCNNFQAYKDIDSCDKSCYDNTPYNKCSENKPLFCNNGKLIEKCKICGCNNSEFCNNQSCSNCKESWFCGELSECINKKQTRNCFDANNCGTTFNKPLIEQSC